MSTRAKLYLASYTFTIMMLLTVFAKPLHIPEAIQWALLLGMFVPLIFVFPLSKRLKQEMQMPSGDPKTAAPARATQKQRARRGLILGMVLGAAVGLASPLWMPVTGTTQGPLGDLMCGMVTAVIICAIFGYKLSKL